MVSIDQLVARARGRCTSPACRAPVIWAETASGKRMPLDPTPSNDGNVVVFAAYDSDGAPFLRCNVLRHTQLSGARAAGQTLRTSHFKTCPDAARHRKAHR